MCHSWVPEPETKADFSTYPDLLRVQSALTPCQNKKGTLQLFWVSNRKKANGAHFLLIFWFITHVRAFGWYCDQHCCLISSIWHYPISILLASITYPLLFRLPQMYYPAVTGLVNPLMAAPGAAAQQQLIDYSALAAVMGQNPNAAAYGLAPQGKCKHLQSHISFWTSRFQSPQLLQPPLNSTPPTQQDTDLFLKPPTTSETRNFNWPPHSNNWNINACKTENNLKIWSKYPRIVSKNVNTAIFCQPFLPIREQRWMLKITWLDCFSFTHLSFLSPHVPIIRSFHKSDCSN